MLCAETANAADDAVEITPDGSHLLAIEYAMNAHGSVPARDMESAYGVKQTCRRSGLLQP